MSRGSDLKPSVYIETTIPMFYYETRTEPDMVAHRTWTRKWWDNYRENYELFTSRAVIDELERGHFPIKDSAIELIKGLPMLEINQPAIIDTVSAYIAHKLMPTDSEDAALHLAIASNYKIDFILTWNCRHLANAKKFADIRTVNGILGLFVPSLVIPLEFIEEDDPVIQAVRAVRHQISEAVGHDVRALVAEINKHRSLMGARIIGPGTEGECSDVQKPLETKPNATESA
jgi:hypothetical protein